MTGVAISAFDGPIQLGQRVAFYWVDTYLHGTVYGIRLGGASSHEPVVDVLLDAPLTIGGRTQHSMPSVSLHDLRPLPDAAVLLTEAEAEAFQRIRDLANELVKRTGSPARSAFSALENLVATAIASVP